jgi:hypothetical protein
MQRLNPLLECIRNVGKEFGDIVPDFQVGRTTCVLYLRFVWCFFGPPIFLNSSSRGQFEISSPAP